MFDARPSLRSIAGALDNKKLFQNEKGANIENLIDTRLDRIQCAVITAERFRFL